MWLSTNLFVVTLVLSSILSLILISIYKINPFIKGILRLYTWLFRGTPLMLQLFFFMYGLPFMGVYIDRMMVAYLTFVLNYSAYFVEILRAGVESTSKDQEESAKVMGANKYQIYRHIILPQAIRKELPSISSEVINLIKDTSLVTVIALTDVLRGVKEIVSRDFTLSPFVVAGLFYLVFSYVIVKTFRLLEQKFDYLDNV
ncbi:Amino acid ABC transporter, permease protein (His/Glu/Gln/Arg/opine family) [Paracholeplasma brassicae]|uniref:Amino acid ABC transporter, permease protein (His/Glu/Gln/Arg/opine family) n=2 Tax=Acholeplasma brassicae TaxID=61635 RepID=U4KRY5_9MOLU|nr:Amino acid ABC transporter, permease protein (His/Glu/Gln/Arg/opine family) [Paracholeplasma brassicae]